MPGCAPESSHIAADAAASCTHHIHASSNPHAHSYNITSYTHTHQYNSHHDVTWHEDNWSNGESRFLAWTLHDTQGAGCGDVYFAFNAHAFEVRVALPPPPPGQSWRRVVDTNLPPPRDFTPGGNAGVEAEYGVAAHAAIMLVSKPLAVAAEPAAAA